MNGTFPKKSIRKLRFNRTNVRIYENFYGFAVGPPSLRCCPRLRLRPAPPPRRASVPAAAGPASVCPWLRQWAPTGRLVAWRNVGCRLVRPAGSPSPLLPGPRSSPRPPPAPPGRPPSPGPRFRAVRLIPCGGGSLGGGPLSAPFGSRAVCPRSRLVRCGRLASFGGLDGLRPEKTRVGKGPRRAPPNTWAPAQ